MWSIFRLPENEANFKESRSVRFSTPRPPSGRMKFMAMVAFKNAGFTSPEHCLKLWRESIPIDPLWIFEAGSKYLVLAASDPSSVAVDAQEKSLLLLYGEVYRLKGGEQASQLLEGIGRRGIKEAESINGSYAILFADKRKDTVMAITDRISSRKVFCSRFAGGYWLSNTLHIHPGIENPLEPVGIASYLANGAMINNRTVFDGVRTLDRACVHYFGSGNIMSTPYFYYGFSDELAGLQESALRKKLSRLLVEAVDRMVADRPKVYLSLSGGYESTTILGILAFELGYTEVSCFSYGLDVHAEGSDANCARSMASLAGMDHQFMKSYEGDPLEVIDLNASLGEGVANFCDEASVRRRLGELTDGESGRRSLFAGDSCLYYSDLLDRPAEESLRIVKVHDFSSLSWFGGMMGGEVFEFMRGALDKEIEAVMRRVSESGVKGGDMEAFLYLDQRLAHVIMPWGDFFCGSAMPACNPILDNRVLEFLMKLPPRMRSRRAVFIATVREMFPDLYRIPRAKFLNSAPDWRREFVTFRNEIKDAVYAESSRLDRIISPEVTVQLLDGLKSTNLGAWKDRLGGVKSRIVSRLPMKAARSEFTRGVSPKAHRVDAAELPKRLLVLRAFLARHGRVPAKS